MNSEHIIPIDFNKVLELPESHNWSKSSSTNNHDDQTLMISPEIFFVLPVIDMKDPNAMQLMKNACVECGMFQIINHGIDTELLQELENQSRKLFALPLEQKLKALRSANNAAGYGYLPISPFFSKFMWHEGFAIQGSPSHHAHLLWPQDSTTATTFCKVMNEYREALNGLSQKIFSMMLMSLGLTHDDDDDDDDEDVKWIKLLNNKKPICTEPFLQLNSYPVCPDPDKAIGIPEHTDSSLLTLLYQGNVKGLQVFHEKEDRWITIAAVPDSFVINVGDLFHILSNGILKSALHRVLVNNSQQRISTAFFFGPSEDIEISPIGKLVEQGKFPLYRSVKWKEYLKLKNEYFNKALEHVRLDLA